jgi:hypothetical protein
VAIHATGASSGPDGLPRYARNDRIPMVHSLRSFRANQAVRALTREALRNKAVHVPDPEADEGGACPAYSLDDGHDA